LKNFESREEEKRKIVLAKPGKEMIRNLEFVTASKRTELKGNRQ